MKPHLKDQIQKRGAPLILAHMGGASHGRENSVEAIQKSLEYHPDIVEVDVRKSKDGVLYCHHGSIPLGYTFSPILRLLTFRGIQRIAGKRDRLEEVLREIPSETIVVLDIKEKQIRPEEVRAVLGARPHVWIMGPSMSQLKEFRETFGENCVYILSRLPVLKLQKKTIARELADLQLASWKFNGGVISNVDGASFPRHFMRWLLRMKPEDNGIVYFYNDLSKAKK